MDIFQHSVIDALRMVARSVLLPGNPPVLPPSDISSAVQDHPQRLPVTSRTDSFCWFHPDGLQICAADFQILSLCIETGIKTLRIIVSIFGLVYQGLFCHVKVIANPFSRQGFKNIYDSSHQYLLNVTFGASLAFQMREEYVKILYIFF